MFVYLARRWRRQPSGALTVDWDNPLTQAIGLHTAWNGTTPRLRFRAASNTLVNSPAAFNGPAVRNSLRGIQTSGVIMGTNNPDIDLGAIPSMLELTYIAVVSQGAIVNAMPFSTRVGTGFELLTGGSSLVGTANIRITTTSAAIDVGVDGLGDAYTHTYFGTWKTGTGARIYVDRPTKVATSNALGGTLTNGQNLKLGNRAGTRWSGFIGLLLVGTKQNIDAGLQLLENPWQIFVPQTKAIISLGIDPNTLLANSGAYSLTGTDATLSVNTSRKVTWAEVQYQAGSVVNTVLDASSGSYSLTGAAATAARTITAASGSYSLVGSDATLNITRILSADSGAYNLTGSSADLPINRSLSADSGAYNVTGEAATLTQAKVISADAGSYALDGQAASFVRTYNLLAAAGAFNLTGSDATLSTAKTLLAGVGSYSLTGSPASLIKFSVYPDPGDVRAGVVYGPGGIYVGTLTVGGKVLYIFDD